VQAPALERVDNQTPTGEAAGDLWPGQRVVPVSAPDERPRAMQTARERSQSIRSSRHDPLRRWASRGELPATAGRSTRTSPRLTSPPRSPGAARGPPLPRPRTPCASGVAALAHEGTLAVRVADQMLHRVGRRAGQSEIRSWEVSFPVLANDLAQLGAPPGRRADRRCPGADLTARRAPGRQAGRARNRGGHRAARQIAGTGGAPGRPRRPVPVRR
jgi:hypothetical protein